MNNEMFEIVLAGLRNGILLKKEDGTYTRVKGMIQLSYLPQLEEYVLIHGTTAQNAGYVLVNDFKNTWDVISNG